MATIPTLFTYIDKVDRESDSLPYYVNDFGVGVCPYHFHRQSNRENLTFLSCLREEHAARYGKRNALSPFKNDIFQVKMDMTNFMKDEFEVKVEGNSVIIDGKHKEREDQHGFITRHIVRRYDMPKGYDMLNRESIFLNGVLTIIVRKQQEQKSNEPLAPTEETEPADLNEKQNTQE